MVVFKDIYPKAPVHLLMVPRQHVESLNDLTSAHDGLMTHMLRTLPEVARRAGLTTATARLSTPGAAAGRSFSFAPSSLGGGPLPGF